MEVGLAETDHPHTWYNHGLFTNGGETVHVIKFEKALALDDFDWLSQWLE